LAALFILPASIQCLPIVCIRVGHRRSGNSHSPPLLENLHKMACFNRRRMSSCIEPSKNRDQALPGIVCSARPAGFFVLQPGLRELTRGTWLLTMRHLTSLARDMSRLLRYTRIWSRFRTLLLSPLLRPSGATLGCYSPLQRSRALGWRWGRVLILGSSLRCYAEFFERAARVNALEWRAP
jgi:hypothetical protein